MIMKKNFILIITIFIYLNGFCSDSKTDKNDLSFSFIDALKNEEFKNFDNAAYLFKTCIDYDSSCGACYYEFSRILRTVEDYKNSLIYAERALNIDNGNYWYSRNLIELLILNRNYKKAFENLMSIINKNDARIEDMVDYAKVLFLLNKEKIALKTLNKIEQKYGISEVISLIKYRYYLNINDFNNAENEIKKLVLVEYNNIKLYGILAELYAIQNKDKDALSWYTKLLVSDSINVDALISLGRFYSSRKDTINAKITFNKIFLNNKITIETKIYAINDFIKNSNDSFILISYLRRILKVLVEENNQNIQLLENYADYFEKINDLYSAAIICKKLCDIKPDNPLYVEKFLYISNRLGNYQEIVASFDTLTKRFSNRAFVFLIGGIAYYQLKKYLKAIELLRYGYNLKDSNSYLKYQYVLFLGESYYQVGLKDSAYYFFDIGTSETNEGNISLKNNYAFYLAENNENLEKALNLSLSAIQKEPKNSYYLDTYAWILFKQKIYRSALKFIKLAYLYNREKNYEILVHYGDISFCNGKVSFAKKLWKESITLGADSIQVNMRLINYKCE